MSNVKGLAACHLNPKGKKRFGLDVVEYRGRIHHGEQLRNSKPMLEAARKANTFAILAIFAG